VSENSILSDTYYNPYAVLIAHIDGEPFFRDRMGFAAFSEASNVFTRECEKYHRTLRKYAKDFVPWAGDPTKSGDEEEFGYDDCLFNPICCVGFGDTDNLAVVAMDDFDLAMRLVSKPNLPIRQTCVAFSPTLESLGLEIGDDVFCTMEDICRVGIDHEAALETITYPRHSFLNARPLVAVTYFKFNGTAVLGPGLQMQQAAYKAIVKQVKTTISDIKGVVPSKKMARVAGSFRCVLLDPQGWADLAAVMFCTDYSVIATQLARIRCLTHEDLYAEWPDGKDSIRFFGLHAKIAQAFEKAAKATDKWPNESDADVSLSANHIFCSTFTTLGMSHDAFDNTTEKTSPRNYTGEVIADTKFVCSAGHCTETKNIASKTRYKARTKSKPGHMWYSVGHSDFLYQQMLDDKYDSQTVVTLSDLVLQMKGMRDCSHADGSEPEAYLSLHALEMSTDLRVPLIAKVPLSSSRPGHIDTRLVLDSIKKGLFNEDHERGFSLRRLRSALTELQIPTPLSTTITFLFLDYANCLSDGFLFDHTLDLHDVFTAVYGLIARRLPEKMREQVKSAYDARTFIDAADLDHLVELIDLLKNALSNRVQVAFREAERWGITLDVRGGSFNRLLNAADVPLKCGLGLLWRVVRGDTDLPTPWDDADEIKHRIGGASRITYDSRSYSHHLDLGYNNDYFVTSVDLNLMHLTRPRHLLVHLHETAHLISHFLRSQVPCTHPEYPCHLYGAYCHRRPTHNATNSVDSHLRDRFEDIFSEMLVFHLVFEDDHKTYLRNYVASCAIESVASASDAEEVFCQIVEFLLRGFLVTDPVRRPQLYSDKDDSGIAPHIVEEGFEQFLQVINDVSSFLFNYDAILTKAPPQRLLHYFTRVFWESYYPVRCIWNDVQTICRGVCEGKKGKGTQGLDPPDNDKDQLIDEIRTGLKKGRPLIRTQYKDPRPGRDSEEYGPLDSLFLVRHLLRLHITNLFGNVDTSNYTCCLTRGLDGHPTPNDPPQGKKWNRQLLDRTYNGLVAADPETRSRHMRERIVILKTFWDISTNLRARRMLDILNTVWPD